MKILKLISNLCILISIIIGLFFGFKYLMVSNMVRVLTAISIIPLILLPLIIEKISKHSINIWIKTLYIIFIFLAQALGSIASFYYYFKGYDKIMHTISGIVSSFGALYVLSKINKLDKKNVIFNIIFVISITLSIAVLWEIFEFSADNIFNIDVQWVKKTGVTDTMTDMIVAFFGSLFFSTLYFYEYKVKSKFIITNYIHSISKKTN